LTKSEKNLAPQKLSFSSEARRDLKGIQDYIAEEKENPQSAIKVVERILDKIEDILKMPNSGTMLSPRVNFETNYRYRRAAGYHIFYRYEKNQIFVDRIIHGRRDYISILFPKADED